MTCSAASSSSEFPSSTWVRLSMDIIVAFFILSINLFILFSVIRYRKKKTPSGLHNNRPSILLVVNLCVADLVVGLSFMYMFMPRYVCTLADYLKHNFGPCIMRTVLVYVGHYSSGFTLVAIAADRYVAVFHALRYLSIMNSRVMALIIAAIWGLAVFLASMLFYWNIWTAGRPCIVFNIQPVHYHSIVVTLYQCIVVGAVSIIYWRIHRVVVKIDKRRNRETASGVHKFNTRCSITLLTILIVFFVSWEPYMIALYVRNSGHHVPPIVFELGSTILKITYLANPFIYALNTKHVRECLAFTFNTFKIKLSTQSTDLSSSHITTGKSDTV